MEEQATEVDQEVTTTNNNLLFHLIGYNNDLLVLNCLKMERCVKSDDALVPLPDKASELIITRLKR